MNELVKEYLWVEKYRPQNIGDCVLPKSIKKTFEDIVSSGNHRIFYCLERLDVERPQ